MDGKTETQEKTEQVEKQETMNKAEEKIERNKTQEKIEQVKKQLEATTIDSISLMGQIKQLKLMLIMKNREKHQLEGVLQGLTTFL